MLFISSSVSIDASVYHYYLIPHKLNKRAQDSSNDNESQCLGDSSKILPNKMDLVIYLAVGLRNRKGARQTPTFSTYKLLLISSNVFTYKPIG